MNEPGASVPPTATRPGSGSGLRCGLDAGERWLAVALVVCAALTIASAPWALALPGLEFVFKPLATLCVIGYAMGRRALRGH